MGSDMLFAIDAGSDGEKVSFKARNVFDDALDMYVRFEERDQNGVTTQCVGNPQVDKCESVDDDTMEAVCVPTPSSLSTWSIRVPPSSRSRKERLSTSAASPR